MSSDRRSDAYERGRKCLRDLKKDRNWLYWSGVINALSEARTEAFEISGTNRPVGSAYNRAFGGILEREKLDSEVLDSATRNHCLQLAEKWAAVEAWRETLPTNLKQTLNHPSSVFRRWRKATEVPEAKEGREPKPTLRDSVATLQEQLHTVTRERDDAKRYVEELEAARAAEQPPSNGQALSVEDFDPADPSTAIGVVGALVHVSKRYVGGGSVFRADTELPAFTPKEVQDLIPWLEGWVKTHAKLAKERKRAEKAAKAERSP